MNRAIRSLSAWLLALADDCQRIQRVRLLRSGDANAAVDNSKLVIKVTNSTTGR